MGQSATTRSVELSYNLTTLTTEVKTYQAIGGQAIFEIGRRLKWVKEHDLAHGEFGKWLAALDIDRTFATRAMKITSELNSNYATGHNLGMKALYEIATMPADERDNPQRLNSGEVKRPDEMTVRELRETKRKLAEVYAENRASQTLLTQADKKAKKLQDEVTQLRRSDSDTKQATVVPTDYQETKVDLKMANEKIADLQELVNQAAADETKRLDYELELKNAQANREHIQADLGVLEAKRQNLLQQNRQLLDVQPSIKSINSLLDQFAVLQNRLDTTTLFDDGDLLYGLIGQLIERGQALQQILKQN